MLSLVFSGSTAFGAFHNASTCAPQTSEEQRRIEDEYLDVSSFGESAFDGGNRKGKRKTEGDIEGLPGTRREKKSDGNSKYDILLDAWSDSMITRKERELAKAERYKSKYGDTTSLFVE